MSSWREDARFRLHCFNRDSFNLSLLKYPDFQGFLVTGQHSGTHWVKWMLSHAIAHHHGAAPPAFVNNSASNQILGHPRHPRTDPRLPRIASSHSIAPFALQWDWLRTVRPLPPYALVVRDIRDVLISTYEKWGQEYGVPFSRFLQGDPRGDTYVCDVWWYVHFLNRWGEVAARRPEQTLVLRYEDFRQDPAATLTRLARHFALELTEADIAAALAVSSKSAMAARQDPANAERPVRLDGEGATWFSVEDTARLAAILDRHLRHDFGYAYFDRPRGWRPPAQAAPEIRAPAAAA